MNKEKKDMVKINGVQGKTIIVEPCVWEELNHKKISNGKRSVSDVIKELLQKEGKVFKHQ